jgi:hypothetical protein
MGPRCPHLKGMIERFFRTVKQALLGLPGAFLTREKHASVARGDAQLGLDELERWLIGWIVDVYHQTKHDTLGCSPAERWGALAAERAPAPAPETKLIVTMGYRCRLKLRNIGLVRGERIYRSKKLEALHKRVGLAKAWEVRWIPGLDDRVVLLDDSRRAAPRWMTVPLYQNALIPPEITAEVDSGTPTKVATPASPEDAPPAGAPLIELGGAWYDPDDDLDRPLPSPVGTATAPQKPRRRRAATPAEPGSTNARLAALIGASPFF